MEGKLRHSPASWDLNDMGEIVDVNGGHVSIYDPEGVIYDRKADEVLILMAPEMYRALRTIVETGSPTWDGSSAYCDAYYAAEKLLAEMEGREPNEP